MKRVGDGARRFDLPAETDRAGVLLAVRALPGVLDVVVTDRHVLVSFAPGDPPDGVEEAIASAAPLSAGARTRHVVRAIYDGPDLRAVTEQLRMSREGVVAAHAGRDYDVEMVGFLPGFAYLGPLGPELARVPRLPSPRPRVPALAIGVAAGRTAVYPFASPGGWHLIGRAVDFVPFDPRTGATVKLGDAVRFVPVHE